jgi:predicted nucleic acid-binding Zn ribbon protein
MADYKFCPQCGSELIPGERFCGDCGFDTKEISGAELKHRKNQLRLIIQLAAKVIQLLFQK